MLHNRRTPGPGGPAGSSWAARYGQVILAHGIAALPTALYYYQGRLQLSAQEVWFVSYILAHKWDAALPHPSLKKMAHYTGMSLSQLKRIRAGLCSKGYLRIEERYGSSGDQETNAYDFAALFSRLEAFLAGDPPAVNAIQVQEASVPPAEGATDMSFVARYGRVIARAGVAAVPQALFTEQAALGLTPQHIWFVAYILAHRWSTELPHPSLVRMAAHTGYTQRHLHNIKEELVTRGYLRLVARRGAEGGKDTNGYDFSLLLDALSQRLQQEPPALHIAPASPDPTPARRRGRRAAPPGADRTDAAFVQPGGAYSSHRGSASGSDGARNLEEGGARGSDRGGAVSAEGGGTPPAYGPAHRLRQGGASDSEGGGAWAIGGGGVPGSDRGSAAPSDQKESDQQEPDEEEDSNLRPRGQHARNARQAPPLSRTAHRDNNGARATTPSPALPRSMPQAERGETQLGGLPPGAYIAAVISDFSREFGDTAHEAANITQAWRLWRELAAPAALDEPDFVQQVLYPARARTRQAQGAQGPRLIENKMAYLFQILRDLVARYGQGPSLDPARPQPDSAEPGGANEAYGSIDC